MPRLYGPQDVPRSNLQAQNPRMPRATPSAFGADSDATLETVGRGIHTFGKAVFRAVQRQQENYDKTHITEGLLTLEDVVMKEYQRRFTEDDPTRSGFLSDFDTWLGIQRDEKGGLKRDESGGLSLSGKGAEIVEALPEDVSPEAKQRLRLRIFETVLGVSDAAGRAALKQTQKRAVAASQAYVNKLAAQAAQNPEFLPRFLSQFDSALSEFLPVLTPDQERETAREGRLTLIESAITGMVDKGDYDKAETLLTEFDNLDPQSRRGLQQIIERGRRVERGEIRGLIDDHLASLQSTGAGIEGLSERVSRVLEPDALAEFKTKEEFALDYHRAIDNARFATPEEALKILDSFRPAPGSEGFAARQRLFESLQSGVRGVLQDRMEDPAEATMAMPEIARAFEKAGNDPAAVRRALRQRLDAQADLGVPQSFRRLLSTREAAGLVEKITQSPSDAKAAVVAEIGNVYGEHLPQVMAELEAQGLDPRYKVLALLAGDPRDAALAETVGTVIGIGQKELKEGIEGSDVTEIERQVSEALAPLMRAIEAGDYRGGRAREVNGLVSVTVDTAIKFYRDTGNLSGAVERATDRIFLDRYHIGDGWYAPKRLSGTVIDPRRIEAQMSRMQFPGNIRDFNPQALGSVLAPDLPEEIRREGLVRTAATSGFWVTEADGKGAILMVPFRGGGALPLRNDTGEPYRVDFVEASQNPSVSALSDIERKNIATTDLEDLYALARHPSLPAEDRRQVIAEIHKRGQ